MSPAHVLRGRADPAHHTLDAVAGNSEGGRGGPTPLYRPRLIKISFGFAEIACRNLVISVAWEEK